MGDRNDTEARILEATRTLFNRKGYRAMTLRDIATAVGIEAQSLYNYTSSKQELVYQMVRAGTARHYGKVERAIGGAGDSPTGQLRAAVEAHVKHFCDEGDLVIARGAIEHLDEAQRAQVLGQMKGYEEVFKSIVREGIARGEFLPVDVATATFAILGMGETVPTWYRRDGRLSAEEVAEAYSGYAVRSLGGDDGAARGA